MQLSPYRALARFAAAAGAGGKIGSAQKENRKTPDGRPHTHAGGAAKRTCEPGARCASRLSLKLSGRRAHPAADAGGAAKKDLRARGAMCVQAQPETVRPPRTPCRGRGRRGKKDLRAGARCASRLSLHVSGRCAHPAANAGGAAKRDLRARGAVCVQAQPGRGEETRTPDILLPKQARYQLRYTSEKELLFILPSFAPEVKKIPQNLGFA